MRLVLLSFLALLMMASAFAPTAIAGPFDGFRPGSIRAAAEPETRQQMIPDRRQAPRIGERQAATRVKQRYADHKILAVQLIETRGPPVYRIKTLSEEGVVKYVFVDGNSGNVFE